MKRDKETDTDCHIIVLLATVSFIGILLLPDGDWLRVMLALPFLAFYPGYLVVAALFYNKKVDPLFHIVLGVTLSIIMVTIMALFLGLSPDNFGIRLLPASLLIYLFTIGFYLIRMMGSFSFRREQRYYERKLQSPRYKKKGIVVPRKENLPSLSLDYTSLKVDRAFAAILVVSIIIAGYGFYVLSKPHEEKWTAFYLTSTDTNSPLVIPSEWQLNRSMIVHLELQNHEKKVVNYTIIGNATRAEPTPSNTQIFREDIKMTEGQSFGWNVTFNFIVKGKTALRFNLYMENKYSRQVHAIINVK